MFAMVTVFILFRILTNEGYKNNKQIIMYGFMMFLSGLEAHVKTLKTCAHSLSQIHASVYPLRLASKIIYISEITLLSLIISGYVDKKAQSLKNLKRHIVFVLMS